MENDDSSARYDPSSGYLTVTLTKEKVGEAFDDLDLLAKLLAPRKLTRTTTNIEVISSSRNTENEMDELSSKTGDLSLEDNELSDGYPTAPLFIMKADSFLQQRVTGTSLKIFQRILPCGHLCRLDMVF